MNKYDRISPKLATSATLFALVQLLVFIKNRVYNSYTSRGWSLELVASGFIAYGVMRAAGSFLIGPLIDRFTATRLLVFHMIPIILGYTLFATVDAWWCIYAYLGLSGLTVGTGSNIKSVIFAEFYGVKILGAINGLTTSLMVVSTALGPILLGLMLDYGLDHSFIFASFIGTGLVTVLLGYIATDVLKDQ